MLAGYHTMSMLLMLMLTRSGLDGLRWALAASQIRRPPATLLAGACFAIVANIVSIRIIQNGQFVKLWRTCALCSACSFFIWLYLDFSCKHWVVTLSRFSLGLEASDPIPDKFLIIKVGKVKRSGQRHHGICHFWFSPQILKIHPNAQSRPNQSRQMNKRVALNVGGVRSNLW